MATTYLPFVPLATGNFTFPATLNGAGYNCVVTWNYYGQRYYLNVYDANGALLVCCAMVASPDDQDINLVAGYVPQGAGSIVYRESSQNIELS